ncbi:hypothetical protein AB3Y40_05850 [Yoonia sp. R2331]|uniref:hypothetical protein n=1 Tax=Yoonia sp. R2331 TaxID=3237238 RepID=UPI0034E4DB50
MHFSDEIKLILLDKGALALVIVIAVAGLNYLLQRSKARADLVQEIATKRAEAYACFWAASEPFRKTEPPELTPDAASAALAKLNTVYFAQGGAMYLSFDAMKKLSKAKDLLRRRNAGKPVTEATLRDAFSAFRTQLKRDLLIYSAAEARAPTP